VKNITAVMAPTRNQLGNSQRSTRPVMWSETVGLRTRPVCDQKSSLGLARWGLGLAGFAFRSELQSCHARL